jgi:methionyl-tRNA formyltransferase
MSYRIVFFGTPDFAVPSLAALLDGPDEVVGVVCQPDRPAGRGQRLHSPPVKELAEQRGIQVAQPIKLRDGRAVEILQGWRPDLIVVAAYGRILPREILDLPPLGCVNVHASLLPKYRGAAPIQWAILCGEAVTGVTIMRMNERMDEGDILLQRSLEILPGETYGELQTRLAAVGAGALLAALGELRTARLLARPQDHDAATSAPMIAKEDGRLDWTKPSEEIVRKVCAYNPWPSTFTRLGDKLLKIHRATARTGSSADKPGTVLALGETVRVAAGRGVVEIEELQLEGRKRLAAKEFARSGQLAVGTVLGGTCDSRLPAPGYKTFF